MNKTEERDKVEVARAPHKLMYKLCLLIEFSLFFFFIGAMMSVDDTLMCSFQILKPADKRKFQYSNLSGGRPVTPPRAANNKNKKK